MTCCIEFPDHLCRLPLIECAGLDETISFAIRRVPSAQEREPRCAFDWRSFDGIDRISHSELAIADPACAPGMISMRPVSGVAAAFHWAVGRESLVDKFTIGVFAASAP